MPDVESRLRQIVSEQLGIGEHEIAQQSRIQEDLGADSLDVYELVMACEDAFSIEIDDETAVRLTTFGRLLEYITAAVAPKRGAA